MNPRLIAFLNYVIILFVSILLMGFTRNPQYTPSTHLDPNYNSGSYPVYITRTMQQTDSLFEFAIDAAIGAINPVQFTQYAPKICGSFPSPNEYSGIIGDDLITIGFFVSPNGIIAGYCECSKRNSDTTHCEFDIFIALTNYNGFNMTWVDGGRTSGDYLDRYYTVIHELSHDIGLGDITYSDYNSYRTIMNDPQYNKTDYRSALCTGPFDDDKNGIICMYDLSDTTGACDCDGISPWWCPIKIATSVFLKRNSLSFEWTVENHDGDVKGFNIYKSARPGNFPRA